MADKLSLRLWLTERYFEWKPVRVLFVREYPGLPTPGGVVNAQKGDEMELPRWQAYMLKSQGYVDVKETLVDPDEVSRVHFSETIKSGAASITSLREDFYFGVKRLIAEYNRAIRESMASMLLREKETIQRSVLEIAERRYIKIVSLAQPPQDESHKDKMAPEELIIFSYLSSIANEWKDYIRRVVEGEDS